MLYITNDKTDAAEVAPNITVIIQRGNVAATSAVQNYVMNACNAEFGLPANDGGHTYISTHATHVKVRLCCVNETV
jgi:hypothetical protein